MLSTTRVMQVIAVATLCQALDLEGDSDTKDTSWPQDHCCRIYEENEFKGKSKDYCTKKKAPHLKEKAFDLTKKNKGKWDNRMMSWKCGRKTSARFCTEEDGVDCDKNRELGESAGGGAESQDTGNNMDLTHLILTHYEPEQKQAITVFELDHCHGFSSVLWEGEEYNDTAKQLTTRTDIQSVMLPEGTSWQVDLYNTVDFVDQYNFFGRSVETMKWDVSENNIDDRNDCLNIDGTFIKRFVRSIKFSET